jgi:hypothetical protein
MILACALLVGGLGFRWAGTQYFRRAPNARYATFLVAGAIWFAVLPAIFGDWTWSVAFLGAGLVEAYLRLRARRRLASIPLN